MHNFQRIERKGIYPLLDAVDKTIREPTKLVEKTKFLCACLRNLKRQHQVQIFLIGKLCRAEAEGNFFRSSGGTLLRGTGPS